MLPLLLPLDELEPGALELEPLGLAPELGLALLPAPPMLEPALPLEESDEPELPLVEGDELGAGELLEGAAPGAAGEVDEVPDGEAPEDEDDEDVSAPAAGAEGVLGVVGVVAAGEAGLVAAEPLEVEPGAAPEVPVPLPESLLQPASSAARMLAANRTFEGWVSFIVDSFQGKWLTSAALLWTATWAWRSCLAGGVPCRSRSPTAEQKIC